MGIVSIVIVDPGSANQVLADLYVKGFQVHQVQPYKANLLITFSGAPNPFEGSAIQGRESYACMHLYWIEDNLGDNAKVF